jgi:CBS domain-containing protein
MKVKDIMEPIKSWLTPEMTLKEAIQTMNSTKRAHGLPVNGIVVLDGAMNLVGIVSTKDILVKLMPAHMYFDDHHHHISWGEIRKNSTRTAEKTRVSDIMTEDVRVIAATESLLHCADILLSQQVRRLPVTRHDGKVIGIVYLRDTYNALTQLLIE